MAQLEAALAPLPQRCEVSRAEAEPIGLSFAEGIAVLTLNRPESLNAMSQVMMRALKARVEEVARLEGIRAVIVTGAGKGFSAGGDLLEFERLLAQGKTVLLETLSYNMDVVQMVEDLPVPVIGAVNGVAVAGGLELLLACDILIAAEGAKIGDGHARYGVVPAAGCTVRLPEKIAPGNAARLFFSAELVPAERLRDWGLITEVVPREQLMERAMEMARAIAKASPEVNRHVKALTAAATRDPGRAARIKAELTHFTEHLEGRDLQAGLAAFRAKKPPAF